MGAGAECSYMMLEFQQLQSAPSDVARRVAFIATTYYFSHKCNPDPGCESSRGFVPFVATNFEYGAPQLPFAYF